MFETSEKIMKSLESIKFLASLASEISRLGS